jgi:DNA-binding NtrC family response regulator
MERAVLLSEDSKLMLRDFSNLIRNVSIDSRPGLQEEEVAQHLIKMDINYGATDLRKLDRHYAKEVLRKMGGNKTQTAKVLGVSRPKLDTLLKES